MILFISLYHVVTNFLKGRNIFNAIFISNILYYRKSKQCKYQIENIKCLSKSNMKNTSLRMIPNESFLQRLQNLSPNKWGQETFHCKFECFRVRLFSSKRPKDLNGLFLTLNWQTESDGMISLVEGLTFFDCG